MDKKKIVFVCNKCGRCCHTWSIHLRKKDIMTLNNLGFSQSEFVDIRGSTPVIRQIEDKCLFLDMNNDCIIQNEFGFDKKPIVCKDFPYNEAICGKAILSEKKLQKSKSNKEYYFRLSDKIIELGMFLKLLDRLDLDKPLFESYLELLSSLLMREEKVIFSHKINKINKIKKNGIKISRSLVYELQNVAYRLSKYPFPGLRGLFNKPIVLVFPLEELYLNKERMIDKAHKKELIFHIKKSVINRNFIKDYPIYLLLILYLLPRLSKKYPSDNNLIDVLECFSALNSLSRFSYPKFDFFKKKALSLNIDLDRYITL